MIRLLFSLLLISIPICAQNENIITYQNNIYFTNEELNEYISKTNKITISDSLVSELKISLSELYNNFGFFNSKFEVLLNNNDNSAATINVKVNENERFVFGDFNIDSEDSSNLGWVIKQFNKLNGKYFNVFDLQNSISGIVNFYEQNGYPFIKITILSINPKKINDQYTVETKIKIKTGDPIKIYSFQIVGNDKTDKEFIEKSSGINFGELYNHNEVNKIKERLSKWRFFSEIEEPKLLIDDSGRGIISLKLTEQNTNNFDGILGYVPSFGNNTEGYFTGFFNIGLRNIFGTGRSIGLRWERTQISSQELTLKFTEPFLLGFNIHASVELYQRILDSTYTKRNYGLMLNYSASDNINIGISFESFSTVPAERQIPVFTVFQSSETITGILIELNTKDDYYFPRSGINFQAIFKYGNKKILGPEEYIEDNNNLNSNIQKYEIDLEFYKMLFDGIVLASFIHFKELQSPFFEISDLYRFGGSNSLRGYRENIFLANRLIWNNLELRYLIDFNTYGFIFCDLGYYLRELKTDIVSEEFLVGYGAGLTLETALGMLKISYALGKNDNFSEGKIHFGIQNEF